MSQHSTAQRLHEQQRTAAYHSPARLIRPPPTALATTQPLQVRAMKNRYGSTDEVGVFEMHDDGMQVGPGPTRLANYISVPAGVISSLGCMLLG